MSEQSQQQVGLSIVMSLVQGRCRENPINIDSPASSLKPLKKKKKKEGGDTRQSSSSSTSSSSSSLESASSNSILVQSGKGVDTNVDDTSGWIDSENIDACDNDAPKKIMGRNVTFLWGEATGTACHAP